jgi:hypothetical protein
MPCNCSKGIRTLSSWFTSLIGNHLDPTTPKGALTAARLDRLPALMTDYDRGQAVLASMETVARAKRSLAEANRRLAVLSEGDWA